MLFTALPLVLCSHHRQVEDQAQAVRLISRRKIKRSCGIYALCKGPAQSKLLSCHVAVSLMRSHTELSHPKPKTPSTLRADDHKRWHGGMMVIKTRNKARSLLGCALVMWLPTDEVVSRSPGLSMLTQYKVRESRNTSATQAVASR